VLSLPPSLPPLPHTRATGFYHGIVWFFKS
jgi:hypothetical protein